jgi:triacylglycerol lipase
MKGSRNGCTTINALRRAAKVTLVLVTSVCAASSAGAAAPGSSGAPRSATESTSYAQTRYPIVLCHGMAGFKSMFGVVDYFGGIAKALRDGGAEVYVTEVPQFNSTEARGEALLAQIEEIVARSGQPKVNLIGHSHGGLDARYVAAVRPDLVASITTIGTPHAGAELATYLRKHLKAGGLSRAVLGFFTDRLGILLGLLVGRASPQNSAAAMESLSEHGMRAFNAKYPAGLPGSRCGAGVEEEDGIRFYSWSGTGISTSSLDPTDLPFLLSSRLYRESNDGIVGKCSSHFGQVLRDDYDMNHLDEVNQLFGFVASTGPSPKSIYRSHASRLRSAGL